MGESGSGESGVVIVANRVVRTWRCVGVVLRKGHSSLEIAAVVDRILVEHNQGNVPLKDVVLVQLSQWLLISDLISFLGRGMTYLDVHPFLTRQGTELVHENPLGHFWMKGWLGRWSDGKSRDWTDQCVCRAVE